eukprot:1540007-Lingulodinium_polyedra.AAC.1
MARVYRKARLDVTSKFVVVNARVYTWWHAHNLRERVGQQYRMVYQTAYQRVRGVMRVIRDLAAQ